MGLLKILTLFMAAFFVAPSLQQPPTNSRNLPRKLYLITIASDNAAAAQPPPRPDPPEKSKAAPFKPSVAVIVGALTTVFSLTFLLLLYARHCKGGNGFGNSPAPPAMARKNSGVDRTVIQSLPVFRFGELRGAKDGLDCAVCLNRFESMEVLRLLPKCKHAFHVECVDTWLDAHSTCPLCRYRIDPEDILLLGTDVTVAGFHQDSIPPPPEPPRRVSGRHSSAESHRHGGAGDPNPPASRRSLDGWSSRNKKRSSEVVSVGCFDRQNRRDGLLPTSSDDHQRSCEGRRLKHRIVIGDGTAVTGGGSFQQRWSDVQPSDLLYLRSEMLISDSRRLSSFSGSQQKNQNQSRLALLREQNNNEEPSGRSVINDRSVSEITGLSRFVNHPISGAVGSRPSNSQQRRHHQQQWWRRRGREEQEHREAGVVSRWVAWISQPHIRLPPAEQQQ